MDWEWFKSTDKKALWEDLEEYLKDYPASYVVLDKLLEFLRYEKLKKIEDAIASEENYTQAKSYCSALDYVMGRLRKLIEKGNKQYVGTE